MIPAVLVPGSRLDVLWLDQNLALNYSTYGQLKQWPAGSFDNLGGTWAAPPAAVNVGNSQLHVFALGTDYTLSRNIFDTTGGDVNWSGWQSMGGNFSSTPAAVSSAADRVDVFCLGADQEMMHTSWNGSTWTTWEYLGGCFTSLPVVVAGPSGTVDIFARGLDFLVYHMAWHPIDGGTWETLGAGLLGQPTSTAAPAAVRIRENLFVFVNGEDGAIWYTLFDGKIWKPWVSLGRTLHTSAAVRNPARFVTEPVAVGIISSGLAVSTGSTVATTGGRATLLASPPPPTLAVGDRVDVFAVGNDSQDEPVLWHKWIDHTGPHGQTQWNADKHLWVETGDWQQVRGFYSCAPSIALTGRAKGAAAPHPADFAIVCPNMDATLHLIDLTPTTANEWEKGPNYNVPSRYRVSVDRIKIENPRSLFSDTDSGAVVLQVGRWPARSLSTSLLAGMDQAGDGTYDVTVLKLGPAVMELCEPASFSYTILNMGDPNAALTTLTTIVKGTEDYINDGFKSIISPAATALVTDDSGVYELLTDAGGGPILIGSLMGAAVGVLADAVLSEILKLVFADCDGIVASEVASYQKGRDIQAAILASPQRKISHATYHPGTNSPSSCGANSRYTVYWSITAV